VSACYRAVGEATTLSDAGQVYWFLGKGGRGREAYMQDAEKGCVGNESVRSIIEEAREGIRII